MRREDHTFHKSVRLTSSDKEEEEARSMSNESCRGLKRGLSGGGVVVECTVGEINRQANRV